MSDLVQDSRNSNPEYGTNLDVEDYFDTISAKTRKILVREKVTDDLFVPGKPSDISQEYQATETEGEFLLFEPEISSKSKSRDSMELKPEPEPEPQQLGSQVEIQPEPEVDSIIKEEIRLVVQERDERTSILMDEIRYRVAHYIDVLVDPPLRKLFFVSMVILHQFINLYFIIIQILVFVSEWRR